MKNEMENSKMENAARDKETRTLLLEAQDRLSRSIEDLKKSEFISSEIFEGHTEINKKKTAEQWELQLIHNRDVKLIEIMSDYNLKVYGELLETKAMVADIRESLEVFDVVGKSEKW